MPRSRRMLRKRSSVNHRRSRWVWKYVRRFSTFRLASAIVEMDEDVGGAQVAVVLGNLVLEDEMVAKRVPGELRCESVILVPIVAVVREDQVGGDDGFQVLEELLDVSSAVRKEAVSEVPDDDLLPLGSRGERPRRLRAPRPPARRGRSGRPSRPRRSDGSRSAEGSSRRSRSRCRPRGSQSRGCGAVTGSGSARA